MQKNLKSTFLPYLSYTILFFIIALILFKQWLGFNILNPSYYDWLLLGDYRQEFAAIHLYRFSPWTLPLGHITDTNLSVGSNVLALEGNLFLGIMLKIFNPILPEMFQPYGLWVFSCLFLQFISLYWALKKIGCRSSSSAFFGAVLIGLLPTFYFRIGHLNLLAHFLIIFTWGVFFAKDINARHKLYAFLFISILSTLIHFYFTPFIVLVSLMSFWKDTQYQRDKKTLSILAKKGGTLVLILLISMWIEGYLGGYLPFSRGFSHYSMNLNALLNSMETSSFIPGLPVGTEGQYEGYQYLGLGILAFLIIGFIIDRKLVAGIDYPVWLLFLFITLFSLSGKIYINTLRLIDVSHGISLYLVILGIGFMVWNGDDKKRRILYALIFCLFVVLLARSFRSSGRLFWFVIYPLLMVVFTNVSNAFLNNTFSLKRQFGWTALMLSLIFLQITDIHSLLSVRTMKINDSEKIEEAFVTELKKVAIKKIIYIDVDDRVAQENMWTKLVLQLGKDHFNISPAMEQRKNIRYNSRKNHHVADTLAAGGVILTNKCGSYSSLMRREIKDDWCIVQDRT